MSNRCGWNLGAVAWVALVLTGCAEELPSSRRGGPSFEAGGAGGSAGVGGMAGVSGVGGASGVGGMAGVGMDPIDPNVCGGSRVEPKFIEVEVEVEVETFAPIAINIALDNSGSMRGVVWDGAVAAITSFVNDPGSAGLDVALNIFPGDPGLDETEMCAVDYAAPKVPMGRLPGHAGAIIAGIPVGNTQYDTTNVFNNNGTNIEPALRGAVEHCKSFMAANAPEDCVVLLISDAATAECSGSKADVPPVAAAALADEGIKTFTMALGDGMYGPSGVDVPFLDQIAQSGGGDCDPASATWTCDLSAISAEAFTKALEAIRDTVVTTETHIEKQKQALECEWGIPDPEPGKTFLKDKVNVNFLPAPGATAVSFSNAADLTTCGDLQDAWRYDDANAPTRILACPATCDRLKASPDATVDIVLGCPTVVVD